MIVFKLDGAANSPSDLKCVLFHVYVRFIYDIRYVYYRAIHLDMVPTAI